MIGKAFNHGVEPAIEILEREIDRARALIGRPTLAQLDRSAVHMRADRYSGDPLAGDSIVVKGRNGEHFRSGG